MKGGSPFIFASSIAFPVFPGDFEVIVGGRREASQGSHQLKCTCVGSFCSFFSVYSILVVKLIGESLCILIWLFSVISVYFMDSLFFIAVSNVFFIFPSLHQLIYSRKNREISAQSHIISILCVWMFYHICAWCLGIRSPRTGVINTMWDPSV